MMFLDRFNKLLLLNIDDAGKQNIVHRNNLSIIVLCLALQDVDLAASNFERFARHDVHCV